jgi:threonine dehydratase
MEIDIPTKIDIEQAEERIKPYIHHTPILNSSAINKIAQCRIFFKCENFQKAGVFKARGAMNSVFSLTPDEVNKGVATHSSGNHAAALALAASIRKATAHIVMPRNANKVKIRAVENYGGQITFCEPTLQAREDTLRMIIGKTDAIEIHPYNNSKIIAGQATAAKELLEEMYNLDIIMAPVGGGGLLSGTALSAHYFDKNIKVIAGEPEGANDAQRSFVTHTFIPSVNPNTIADGLLTSLGSLTYKIIMSHVYNILIANDEEIIQAMKLIWERLKIICEPSSAVPLAVLLKNKSLFTNKNVGIIISGGNVDLNSLPFHA